MAQDYPNPPDPNYEPAQYTPAPDLPPMPTGAEAFPPPPTPPAKKNRTWTIVLIVLLVLCVCCAAVAALMYFWLGDIILNNIQFQQFIR